MRVEGAWTTRNLAPLRALLQSADVRDRSLEWDFSATGYLDSASIGLLAILDGSNRRSQPGRGVSVASPAVRRLLNWASAVNLLITVELDLPRGRFRGDTAWTMCRDIPSKECVG